MKSLISNKTLAHITPPICHQVTQFSLFQRDNVHDVVAILGILFQELRTPQKYSPMECDGVQLHQYWMTLLLYVYMRPITKLI